MLRSLFQRREMPVDGYGRPQPQSVPLPFLKPQRKALSEERSSRGLEQFFYNLQGQVGLNILDLAGASQQNIDFLTNLGHRIYTGNMHLSLDECFGADPTDQSNPGRLEYFIRSNFDYPPETFDGVMMWDGMQFMGPALLKATADKLAEIMRPKAYLLAFFNVDDRLQEAPAHTFRIQDSRTIVVTETGVRKTSSVFNNRSLEKLFGQFESVKFFLTRGTLREVIVRR